MERLVKLAAVAAGSWLAAHEGGEDGTHPATGMLFTSSLNGIRALARGLVPILESALPASPLPDIPFDELSLTGVFSNVKCGQVTAGGLDVKTSSSTGGALEATAFNLSTVCTADFFYKEKLWPFWPQGEGGVQVTVAGASATATVTLGGKVKGERGCGWHDAGISAVRPALGLHLCLSTLGVAVDAGTLTVTFTRGPPVLDWILTLLARVFRGTISSFLEAGLERALRRTIDETASGRVETMTSTHPYVLPPPAGHGVVGLRAGLPAPPTVHGNSSHEPGQGYVHVPLRGDVIPSVAEAPHRRLPLRAPPPPPLGATASAHHVQLWVSNYSLASPLYAVAAAGAATFTAPSSSLPASLNTTAAWAAVVPALSQAYGAQAGVGLHLSFPPDRLPSVTSSSWPDGAGSTGLSHRPTLALLVYTGEVVGEGEAAVTWDAALDLNASCWIPCEEGEEGADAPPVLYSNLPSLSFHLLESSVWTAPALGPSPRVDTAGLNTLLSMLLTSIVLPLLNRAMEKGVALPAIPLGHLPTPHGEEPRRLAVMLRRTRLLARGPGGEGEGDGRQNTAPTASAGLYLTTDLELVTQAEGGGAWEALHLAGEASAAGSEERKEGVAAGGLRAQRHKSVEVEWE